MGGDDKTAKPTIGTPHNPSQVSGTAERPRLAVFRSNNHIYAQVRRIAGRVGHSEGGQRATAERRRSSASRSSSGDGQRRLE